MNAHYNKYPDAATFFATHPVFTHEEFVAAHTSNGKSPHTSNNILANHVAAGRLLRVRRGLYFNVPRGIDVDRMSVDPYLVATKLTDDAVVAYHAALQFHGKAYSLWQRFHYCTGKHARPFSFRGLEFLPVKIPTWMRADPDFGGGVVEIRHGGGYVRVATLERTLVDVLDAPEKCGGWEEIWRSLEMVEFFDLDAVTEYALNERPALTVARVGFFLEQNRRALMVEDHHLQVLEKQAPRRALYLDSSRQSGKLVRRWNLVVPEHVLKREWQEVM